MPDFTVRSDSINVEQVMEQIRARIREKRGVDYTEQQIRELAAVKLEKFLDPKGVRSDLLEEFRRMQAASAPPAPPNYAFGEETLFETHRGSLRLIRRLLQPLLKLFFNPNPLIQALHIQAELNTLNAQQETARRGLDQLHFEVLHNLVLETTRMGIELKNLKMRVESLTGRLEFNERRARALESVVAYRPPTSSVVERREPPPPPPPRAPHEPRFESREPPPNPPSSTGPLPRTSSSPAATSDMSVTSPGPPTSGEGPGQRSRRRRRRRGRRGGGSAVSIMGTPGASPAASSAPATGSIQDAMSVETQPSEPVEPARSDTPSGRSEDPPYNSAPSTGSDPSDDQ